jgi:hypothetical protein
MGGTTVHRIVNTLSLVAASVLALLAVPTTTQAAAPIGPNEIFLGEVNSQSQHAVITVVCPGPSTTGHPFGDTVAVVRLQDPIFGFGRTGNAHQISVDLSWATGPIAIVEHVTTFTTYTSENLPATLTVPCSGTGTMTFNPVDGGPSALPATVSVTFRNIGA